MTLEEKTKQKLTGREDALAWDDYFMGIAMLSAQRSKDPNTQVGACLVNTKNRIVGTGYNGWVSGTQDEDFPWEREGEYHETKYAYVVHAEANAILNATRNLEGSKLYVTMAPCNECAKLVAQKDIAEVIYYIDPYHDAPSHIASRKILEKKGVKMTQYIPPVDQLTIDYAAMQKK